MYTLYEYYLLMGFNPNEINQIIDRTTVSYQP